MLACSSCGRENPEGARFCIACGAPLAGEAPAGVRKTVTALFCDLVGSTSLGDRTDPELLRELMGRYHADVRTILERHGGTVEKFVGDAAMAVFGIPQAHEDDALRAVRAADEIRDAVAGLGRGRCRLSAGRGPMKPPMMPWRRGSRGRARGSLDTPGWPRPAADSTTAGARG